MTNGGHSPASGESPQPFPSTPAAAPRLIVFTRFPEPGKVKTRLIRRLGAAGAADLHRELTAHALTSASVLAARSGVCVEVRFDGGSEEAMRTCFGEGVSYRPQGEGDLGERMARSAGDALGEGVPRVVLIGSDCPGVSPEILGRAFDLLAEDSGRVVLGPALDGGYYLIGMSRRRPELFRGIAWGTEHVFRQTEAAARESGYPLRTLEPLADVDRPEDLHV
ncbi:MAG: TIGR04282 family arsenosugar biosynthesis glycosyltransferase, partial [Planctomycetia bacterium]|nr:TIGR04282 family arsenosugar biosynthesis glycosyltransferase [Planctomycetia bacterium]